MLNQHISRLRKQSVPLQSTFDPLVVDLCQVLMSSHFCLSQIWHSELHSTTRSEMSRFIIDVITQGKLQSHKTEKNLVDVANVVETRLYHNAGSYEE
jgi:hypothetical protein